MKLTRRMALVGALGGLGLAGGIASSTWAYLHPPTQVRPRTSRPILAYIGGVTSPFYDMIGEGAEATAQQRGLPLLHATPTAWDPHLQTQMVEAIIPRVDAILIAPCDNQALIAPLRRASEAGVTICTVDTVLGSGDYEMGPVTFPVGCICSDNLAGGRLAGEAMLSLLKGKGKVALQSTASGVSATDLREQGFKQALQAAHGSIEIVKVNYDHGNIQTATEQMRALLLQEPDVAGIFGTGDYSSKGVMQALQQTGRLGSVQVVRFDASEEAVADLQAGRIACIISQQPKAMGELAVQHLLAALDGKPQPKKMATTGLVVLDREHLATPQAQAAIYR